MTKLFTATFTFLMLSLLMGCQQFDVKQPEAEVPPTLRDPILKVEAAEFSLVSETEMKASLKSVFKLFDDASTEEENLKIGQRANEAIEIMLNNVNAHFSEQMPYTMPFEMTESMARMQGISPRVIVQHYSYEKAYSSFEGFFVHGDVKISHASNCVIIATGKVTISHMNQCIVFAQKGIEVSFDGFAPEFTDLPRGSLLISPEGLVKVSHSRETVIYSAVEPEVSWKDGTNILPKNFFDSAF